MRKQTYSNSLLYRIEDNKRWPKFERADFMQQLNSFADSVYSKNTTEGYLAALLIYQQLCEEMIKLMIECSNFLIQLSVFPSEIKPVIRDDAMFGQLLSELERGILDDNIKLFILECRKLNGLRIKMVHKITLKTSIDDIKEQSKQAKNIFDKILKIFELEYDFYKVNFRDYKKNIEDLKDLVEDK